RLRGSIRAQTGGFEISRPEVITVDLIVGAKVDMVGISRVGERDPRAGVAQVDNPFVPGEAPDEYPDGPDEQQVPTQCDRLDACDAMLRGHRDFDELTGAPIEGEEMPGLLGADVQGIPGGSDRAYVLFATQG